METRGGGNCANALTAASRLGTDACLVTKVGNDRIGQQIVQELQADGVNTDFLLRSQGASHFSYMIVDKQGGTRTCIQTPGVEYTPEDLQPDNVKQILNNASLVYFDGRLTASAILLAKAARQRGVPVLVEAERLREGLDELLKEADYLCTSAHFPKLWTGKANLDCVSKNDVHIRAGNVSCSSQAYKLQHTDADTPTQLTASHASIPAAVPAASPEDDTDSSGHDAALSDATVTAGIIVASAACVPQEAIEDTTGAGDAYIGSVLYGITQQMPLDQMMMLAALVAACNCTALGARPALPYAADITASLLVGNVGAELDVAG
ncbi:hypothetical protein WJX79_010631 [Trebouxia sp. C0005]